jgi:putative flippase GtrA
MDVTIEDFEMTAVVNDTSTRLNDKLSMFYRFSEIIRMTIVALSGTLIGWLTYEIIYLINPLEQYRATSTWLIEFTIGVMRQHALHRYFTFKQRSPYWRTLFRAYVFYISSAVLTSTANLVFIDSIHMHYRLAWALCTLMVALMSLLFLKRKVFLINESTQNSEVRSKKSEY